MLQETNKFREHQAREILIEVLEKQLEARQRLVLELENDIEKADMLLSLGDEGQNHNETSNNVVAAADDDDGIKQVDNNDTPQPMEED